MPGVISEANLGGLVALATDEDTVSRVGDLDTLKVEVFHRCVGVGLNIIDAADSSDVNELFPTIGSHIIFDAIFENFERCVSIHVLIEGVFSLSGNMIK